MPTYEYRCKDCDRTLEVVQSFTDDALTVCPHCSGPLRKLFGNVGITFKGSGFYKTDSRANAKAASGAKANGSSGGDSKDSSSSDDKASGDKSSSSNGSSSESGSSGSSGSSDSGKTASSSASSSKD